MSDLTRDSPERYSNSYPSSRRKPKNTTYHDGRSNEEEYVVDDYAATSPPTMSIPTGTSNTYDNTRTVAASNPRFNDDGSYSPEQQEQLNPYSFAPLNSYPPGGSHSLYALNTDTGNSSKLTAKDSYNKVKNATNQGNSYHGPISSTANTFNVLNVIYSGSSLPSSPPNPTAASFPPHSPTNYVPQSDRPAPPMQPSLSDPSYNQRGGHRHSKDIENRHMYQAKHSYSYSQGQSSETIPPHDKNAWSQTSKRDPREATSDRYEDNSSGPSPYLPQSEQYNPSVAKGFRPERQFSKGEWVDKDQDSASRSRRRREPEDRRQSKTSGQDSKNEEKDEDIPKVYPINPQRSRTSALPPSTSSSWTGKEDDFTYSNPSNTRYNMTSSTDSVQTVRPDNHRSRHSSGSRDLASGQEHDSAWASEPRLTYGSSSSSVHGNVSSSPSSLPSASSKAPPRSTSLPTSSSLPSQPRQNSARPMNPDGQDTPTNSVNYGLPSEIHDEGRQPDFRSNRMYDSPPNRVPPLARGVSDPPQHGQGGSWHRLPPSAIQPQTGSRDPPRQESTINQSWVDPSNPIPYGANTSPSTAFGGDKRMEGRHIIDPSSARGDAAPTGYQYPNQVGPGAWPGPYGPPSSSSSSGAMFSGPGGYSQSQASTSRPRYEHDLSQQFAQTSIINPPRGPLMPIPETQHQAYASTTSFNDRDKSRASLSTLPDKCTSIGNPYLRPLRNRTQDGRRRKKAPDAENYISLYMASDIVDEDTTPLWTPCPKSRGATRQQHGIEVGDLGYMDESGEFTTIFNIFYSHEDNALRGAKPPPFNHYHPLSAERHEVVRKVDIQNNHFYLSENIERRSAQAPGQFRFSIKRKSGRSGAIIVLPHGGTTSTLRSKFFQYPHVKKYFQDNAASWYQHIHRSPDIPNLSNGSLIFVHGTHLARTWGIATFLSRKHDSGESQGISFVPGSSSNPYEYQWDWYTEKWKVKRGPSPEELASLQYGQRPPKNQCIGIIASSVFLDEKTWQAFFSVERSSALAMVPSRVFNPFNRILSRVSSLSSIKVDRPPGRRYMESYLENQGGSHHAYDYDLFRIDV